MARIGRKNTLPELLIRKGLWAAGLRYRIQTKTPGGTADLVLATKKFALFVDGCFWHGCPEHYVRPRTSSPFWDRKLRENVDRDRRQTLKLLAEGWRVLRVWEHEVHEQPARTLARILRAVDSERPRKPRGAWRVVRVTWLDEEGRRERRICESLLDASLRHAEERTRSTRKVGRVRGRVLVAKRSDPRGTAGP